MPGFLLQHWPHLALALPAFAVVVVSALRVQSHQDEALAALGLARAGSSAAPVAPVQPVSPRIARLGLLALAPLCLAVLTGVAIYAVDLAGARPGAVLIVAHSAISTLALVQIAWKLAAIGRRRLRAALGGRHAASAMASLVLALLGVPLLLTGVALLVTPGSGSPFAYVHLIAGAWWTVLLGMHLARHLPRALGAGSGATRCPR